MKKIGILTHFYESMNYGGILQAYALAEKLKRLGFNAEQISYKAQYRVIDCQNDLRGKLLQKIDIERIFASLKVRFKKFFKKRQIKRNILATNEKKNCFYEWVNQHVQSSSKVYNISNIKESNQLYHIFITGSDQVWNYNWYDPNYFLDFVDNSKNKIAYAASMGHSNMPNRIKEIYRRHLESFKGVSVREQNMVELFNSISPVNVEWVVDPVFLLEKEEWNKVASNNMKIEGKYVFCYFLGENTKERKIVQEYATKKGLCIVTIRDLMVEHNKRLNEDFSDIKLANVNPGEFLTLIKNAECVFTDSFHATAFSLIYQKNFYAFNRNSNGKMNDRIKSVLTLFDVCERFCEGENETLSYVLSLPEIDYHKASQKVEEFKRISTSFLTNHLEGVKFE